MQTIKVGLALGGGAVRGFAHVGVLLALERASITISCISGSSAGAVVGAFYAAGYSAQQIRAIGLKMGWRELARLARPGRGGLISFHPLEMWLAVELGDPQFSDLKLPFAAVATDLAAGNPVVLRSGRVAPAVHASAAFPGIVAPVRIGDRRLVDGGAADSLPVRAVTDLGADYVIASSIVGSRWSDARSALGTGLAAVESTIRWAGGGLLLADCLLECRVGSHSYWAFRSQEQMIAAGERAAEEKIPSIRAALDRLSAARS